MRPWETGVKKPYSVVTATTFQSPHSFPTAPLFDHLQQSTLFPGWSGRSLVFCLSNPSGVRPGLWPHLCMGFEVSLGYIRLCLKTTRTTRNPNCKTRSRFLCDIFSLEKCTFTHCRNYFHISTKLSPYVASSLNSFQRWQAPGNPE